MERIILPDGYETIVEVQQNSMGYKAFVLTIKYRNRIMLEQAFGSIFEVDKRIMEYLELTK